jgi:hypothetical protein
VVYDFFSEPRDQFICLTIYVETQSYGGEAHAAYSQQQSQSAEVKSSARAQAVCYFQ